MVIAPGQQRLAGWRTQRGRVKASELQPPVASRSAFGVAIGPPKALEAPNPQSSIRTISTLGAPVGGRSDWIGGNAVSGSFAS